MSRTTCSYFECKRNRKSNCDLSLFRFPIEEQRSRAWLSNCGNADLFTLSENQLRNKTICALHFNEKDFINSCKNRLVYNAIPLHYEVKTISDRGSNHLVPTSPAKLTLKREAAPKVYTRSLFPCLTNPGCLNSARDNPSSSQSNIPETSSSFVEVS